MSEAGLSAEKRRSETSGSVVRRVVLISGGLLLVLAGGGWYIQGWPFACSVLIGGVLVNGSFCLLGRDAQRLMGRLAGGEDVPPAMMATEKTRFFLRYFARLVVLGLLLFSLAAQVKIDVIGLILGLSTIMVSVVINGLGVGQGRTPNKV